MSTEEMKEKIHVEDETGAGGGRRWTEEFKAAGEDLLRLVKNLLQESNVRRVVIVDADGRRLLDLPVWMGVAGVTLLPTYAAIGLVAGMMANVSIIVERAEPAAG